MYKINDTEAEKIESVTFSNLDMKENDIEEILRCNIDMLCDDEEEEAMLIVGRQVKNQMKGRSDLTAVDNEGNLVLIEIKRDPKDIENRKEAFEFQAIRYAASYATIESPDQLVQNVYTPYIEKYRNEFELAELTPYELAIRKLNEFLSINNAEVTFNKKQKIILVASDYDEQTLSAVAWLNNNNVDISCYKIVPYKINSQVYFNVEKVLPVATYDDYYVDLMDKPSSTIKNKKRETKRRSLPKIDAMLDWGVVKEGDIIVAKGKEDEEVTLRSNGKVIVQGEEKSLQSWLKDIYGWSSVQTYRFAIQKESGKSLSEIRKEYMDKHMDEING